MRRKSGFSPSITGRVTVYPKYTNKETGEEIAVKCVLEGCFWSEDSISTFHKTGQQTNYNVTLTIPFDKDVTGREYINPSDWNSLAVSEIEKYWTADPKSLPLIVKGESNHEFQWQKPDSPNRLVVQENNF